MTPDCSVARWRAAPRAAKAQALRLTAPHRGHVKLYGATASQDHMVHAAARASPSGVRSPGRPHEFVHPHAHRVTSYLELADPRAQEHTPGTLLVLRASRPHRSYAFRAHRKHSGSKTHVLTQEASWDHLQLRPWQTENWRTLTVVAAESASARTHALQEAAAAGKLGARGYRHARTHLQTSTTS